MGSHFAVRGEDTMLVALGHEVCREYPRMWELNAAAEQNRQRLRTA
jgi:hypothetical protein